MASRSTEPVPISGRVDCHGRLVEADAALERLQVEAGSRLGRAVALPQLAALARAAASLGVPLSRTVNTADSHHDIDLFVRAEPVSGAGEDANEVRLTIERWVARPMSAPRLALVGSADVHDHRGERESLEFETDAALNMVDVSPSLASLLGVDPNAVPGDPLTSLFRLIEEADGALPLLGALATQAALEGQRAAPRNGGVELTIDADPLFDEHGRFAGFHARVRRDGESEASMERAEPAFEDSLDDALRSPLARIISAADHIVERGDGPLRSDYATYASDIAAAGRHLLSVIRSMGQSGKAAAQRIDLAALAREAVGLVQPIAEPRHISIEIERFAAPCPAEGEARAVVQVLVNILGNAVRHSPDGGTVAVVFDADAHESRVTIADQGPGIDRVDQQRIFDRYERVGTASDGSGLGLAISRRLARSMGGDIRLESAPGEGARFTLILPTA
ncbi:MAG: HAMP domain-containing histidine kinase [Pseudomonadota bacterium]|nr:HAMP domain-containing histidine kinase [Pseudomonadota bacterium]